MKDENYKKLVESFIETLNTIEGCNFWTGCSHTIIQSTIMGFKFFEPTIETGFYLSPYTGHTKISKMKTANLVAIDILIYQQDPDLFYQWFMGNNEVQNKKSELESKGVIYIAHYDLRKILDRIKELTPLERDLTPEEKELRSSKFIKPTR